MGGGLTRFIALATAVGCLFALGHARAEEREHAYVLEIGPAGEWPLKGEKNNFGGSFAVESTLIENCWK
jgi:hypothetical protein